ncbi:hypothetical protein Enr10x_32100 [Gimesia panareensis]|uniref:Uncharacterized protein n=1 Tax=Gimesia panareensis TaxID=2527978 RepID=A0A517Q8C2_9PLAN|nr:hypothetical protein [Gimesia panareensis]QDT27875.1 hypothetical protein Enr10x_32100 [Gimesia panareensis]
MDSLFSDTDFFSLLFPALIFLYVGQLCVKSNSKADLWSKRIASFQFVLMIGVEILTGDAIDPYQFSGTVTTALVVAGMALGLCWILLPILFSLYEQTIGAGVERLRSFLRKRRERLQEKKLEQERKRSQKEREAELKRRKPEQEQQQQEAERRKKYQEDQQRRREEVRLQCQLLYDQHALELRDKLKPERLESYFHEYLSDQYSAEMVEKRGELLKEMIAQSLGKESGSQANFNSLQEIALYFREQRIEIENLEYDAITLQTIQASLSAQEEALIRAFLSRNH